VPDWLSSELDDVSYTMPRRLGGARRRDCDHDDADSGDYPDSGDDPDDHEPDSPRRLLPPADGTNSVSEPPAASHGHTSSTGFLGTRALALAVVSLEHTARNHGSVAVCVQCPLTEALGDAWEGTVRRCEEVRSPGVVIVIIPYTRNNNGITQKLSILS